MAAQNDITYKQIRNLLQGVKHFYDYPSAISYGSGDFFVNKAQALKTLRNLVRDYRGLDDKALINHLHESWNNGRGRDARLLNNLLQRWSDGTVSVAQLAEKAQSGVAVAEQPEPTIAGETTQEAGHSGNIANTLPSHPEITAGLAEAETKTTLPPNEDLVLPKEIEKNPVTPINPPQEASFIPKEEPVATATINNNFTTNSNPEVVKVKSESQAVHTNQASLPLNKLSKIQPPQFALNGLSKFRVWMATTNLTRAMFLGAVFGGVGGFIMAGPLGAGLGVAGGAVLGHYIEGNPYRNYPIDNPIQQPPPSSRFPNFRPPQFTHNALKGFSKLAKTGAKRIVEEAALANPISITIAIVAAIIIALGLPIIMSIFSSLQNTTALVELSPKAEAPPIQSLVVLTKTGPASIDNGQNIIYTLNATYTGSGTADIEVVDHLPDNGSAATPSESGVIQNKNITWELKGLSSGQSKILTFTFTPDAGKTDFWLANYAEATIKNQTGGGSSGGNSQFDSLMAGQGRNTQVLGNENDFVSTVMANAASGGFPQLVGQETDVRAIYQASIAHNVNPLIVLTIWGVEQTFAFQSPEFGCKLSGSDDFNSQLNCSAVTLDNWMNDFNQNQRNGSLTITSSDCTYTDAFLYAYEIYTPVCHKQDHNESSRSVFTSIYTKLLGK